MGISAVKRQTEVAQQDIELKEVDFREFDRRKTPRLNSYDAFVEYTNNLSVDSDQIEFIN